MKKLFIIILIITASINISGENLPWEDYKAIHLGFVLGTNMMDFGIFPSLITQDDGKIYQADVAQITPGFTVGVITDFRLNNYFDVRIVPTLNLADRELKYVNNVDNEIFETSIKSTTIMLPLYLKYSAVRIDEYRPYLLIGGGVALDLAHDKQKPVLLNYGDYYLEVGVGWSIYLEYFKLSPEIKFSLGLNNVLTPWNERRTSDLGPKYEPYTNALSKLTNRIVTICFNFE